MLVSTSFSQNFEKVYQMTTMSFDKVKKEWVEQNVTYPSGIYVMLKGSEVIITSDYQQRIYTYGEAQENDYPTHKSYTWKAIDKSGINCKFIFKVFKNGTIVYMFLYDGACVEYVMQK